MKPIAWTFAILMLGASAAASGSDTGTAARYAGQPYMGDVDVRVRAPDGSLKKTDKGTGSAHFEKLGGSRTRLIVDGQIGKEPASFVLEGSDTGSGWRASNEGVVLTITPDGSIRGNGNASTQRFRFDGKVSDARFGLEVELEVLQAKPGGPAPGTKFLFHYDLSRDAVASAGRTAPRTTAAGLVPTATRTTSGRSAAQSNRKCKRTVWQTRNVASLSSAPMIMVRVPQCVQW